MGLKTLLKSDVDDVLKPVAGSWIGLLQRRRVTMTLVTLGSYVLVVVLAWVLVGRTAGLLALAATLALYGYGVIRAWRYWLNGRT